MCTGVSVGRVRCVEGPVRQGRHQDGWLQGQQQLQRGLPGNGGCRCRQQQQQPEIPEIGLMGLGWTPPADGGLDWTPPADGGEADGDQQSEHEYGCHLLRGIHWTPADGDKVS